MNVNRATKNLRIAFCLIAAIALISTDIAAAELVGRDPTMPPAGAAINTSQTNSTFELQSIMISDSRRVAMINQQYVMVGNTVDGAKVIEIQKNAVVLLISGKATTIYLFDGSIRN